jgi:protein gp37
MSNTTIAWTDSVWNPVRGCTEVSPGCKNCYARGISARFSGTGQPFEGYATRSPARWTHKVGLIPEKLDEPLHWRKPRKVFVNSMSDLFHEGLPEDDIADIYGVMVAAWWHTFQVLTKRPERRCELLSAPAFREKVAARAARRINEMPRPRPGVRVSLSLAATVNLATWNGGAARNIWEGTSVEDQPTANKRIPLLLQTPAAVRFVSYEPALGPVNFREIKPLNARTDATIDALAGTGSYTSACGVPGISIDDVPRLDQVIVGGESGHRARSCDVAWIRSVVEQCKAAGVAAFVKQRGALWYDSDRREGLRGSCVVPADVINWRFVTQRDRAGEDPEEWPEDLRVREFPSETP